MHRASTVLQLVGATSGILLAKSALGSGLMLHDQDALNADRGPDYRPGPCRPWAIRGSEEYYAKEAVRRRLLPTKPHADPVERCATERGGASVTGTVM